MGRGVEIHDLKHAMISAYVSTYKAMLRQKTGIISVSFIFQHNKSN